MEEVRDLGQEAGPASRAGARAHKVATQAQVVAPIKDSAAEEEDLEDNSLQEDKCTAKRNRDHYASTS